MRECITILFTIHAGAWLRYVAVSYASYALAIASSIIIGFSAAVRGLEVEIATVKVQRKINSSIEFKVAHLYYVRSICACITHCSDHMSL